MQIRKRKQTDQEEIEKAFSILTDCVRNHPEIEETLWAGAFWSVLVEGYCASRMPYELFCYECDEVKEHYKSWFEE